GLKLEIAGRADPATDVDGLKRLELERRVKAQKLRETVRQGSDSGSLDEIQLSAQEWPKYLEAAYKREKFDKPRNLVGLAKSLPPAEMEKLILANIQVGEEELRALADRRAKAVREWLDTNGVPDERLFIIGSHLGQEDSPAGVAANAALSRTEFSLK
ncbi:MAG: hypothetical protein HGA47_14805, partial [Zoogloea sp.]|nr:hypothetical protein [Zoogloea sp.]